MEVCLSEEEQKDMFAEEMVKHVLLKVFGIYWEPEMKESQSPKLPLRDFHSACILLGEAATTAWQKFYAAVEQESIRIHELFKSSVSTENVCTSLKEVSNNIDLPKEFLLIVVMAVFGDLCVRISKSGAEHLITTAVSGAKKYIVEEGLASNTDLQRNTIEFMEFCDGLKSTT